MSDKQSFSDEAESTVFRNFAKCRDATDMLVGHNIRLFRLHRRMSQTALADALGVSFQQVQKYEKGANGVRSGRLFKIAEILDMPIGAFFDGIESRARDVVAQSPAALLNESHALRLVKAFCTLTDSDLRRTIADMIEVIAMRSRSSPDRAARPTYAPPHSP